LTDLVVFGPFRDGKNGRKEYGCPYCGKWLPINRNKRDEGINRRHYQKHKEGDKKDLEL